jgi:hypothetical protein
MGFLFVYLIMSYGLASGLFFFGIWAWTETHVHSNTTWKELLVLGLSLLACLLWPIVIPTSLLFDHFRRKDNASNRTATTGKNG